MKILSFSLDPLMLDSDSTTANRARGYGDALTKYTVIIPSAEKKRVVLSEKVTVIGTGGKMKLLRWLRLYRIAKAELKKDTYDVVSAQDPYFIGLTAYQLAKRFHTGFEIQILGLYHLTWLRVQLARWLLPKAGSLRILSHGLKKRLLSDEFGMQSDTGMHVVPIYADVSTLGFDEAKMSESEREEFHASTHEFTQHYQNRFNFLTVGRLVPVKNIPMQLRAVAALKEKYPELLLHVVGPGDQTSLARQIAELGIAEHVIVHGPKYHAELGTFFTQSDCFLLTSDSEGWGMVVIEAATARLPIIMTNVGCAESVIKHNESGLIIPVRDTDALIDAMQSVLSDVALRTKLTEGTKKAIADIPDFPSIVAGCVASWKQASEHKL